MQYPERPTCHDGDYQAKRFPEHLVWRRHPPDRRWPKGEPYRTCGYCGSIHPEDLIAALAAGAELQGSDWKYGWPHKFYLVNIPNPHADETAEIGGKSYWSDEAGRRVYEPTYAAQGNFNSKWYNTHIMDEGMDDEARAKLIAVLEQHSGITFKIEDGKLMYAAPHRGYQR
jgi:hypothetical protein